ncbi:MAG: hypothetical protein ACXVPU_18055 [Bacteroidia bacterium]
MKITEKIIVVFILLSVALKVMLVPGASPLFLLITQLLVLMYFIFGFALFNGIRLRNIFKKESYTGISPLRMTGAALMGITLSMVGTGFIFKLLLWPGSQAMLLTGSVPLFIILIIVLIKYFTTKSKFYFNAIIRCGIFSLLTALLLFTNNLDIVKIEYRNYPAYIEAYEAYSKDPGNIELNDKLDLESKRTMMRPEEFKYYEEYYNSRKKAQQ